MPITKPSRVLIVGFDGATLDVIRPLIEAGELSAFGRLMAEGAWGPLRTIVPPITPTAWTSFATGTNPGKHGLFDFTGRKPGSYDTYLNNAAHRRALPLWQILSQAGRRVTVHNVPITYPPDHVNGLMVSGLLTPASATDASWPPELQRELQEAVPDVNFSPPGMHSKGREVEFVRSVRDLNQTTLRAARYLMDRQPWDCMVTIFMGTDIMSHFMWKHMETGAADVPEPTRSTLVEAVRDCYRDADGILAELMSAAGDDTCVIVMSDHGFGGMDAYISVNTWLARRGYLRFKRSPLSMLRTLLYRAGLTPLTIYGLLLRLQMGDAMRQTSRQNIGLMQRLIKGLFLSFDDVDWTRTRAYSVGYAGPIFINLQGREPRGIVRPGAEYEALLTEIVGDLGRLKEPGSGEPFAGAIYRGTELYTGSEAWRAPDLIFMPRNPRYAGLGLVDFPSNRWLTPSPDRSGFHRMDGILFVHGPGVRTGCALPGASIMDVAPTALALLGVPVPRAMDGRVLDEILTPELLSQLDITYSDSGDRPLESPEAPDITSAEEESMREHLRGLGYVA